MSGLQIALVVVGGLIFLGCAVLFWAAVRAGAQADARRELERGHEAPLDEVDGP